MRGRGRYDRAFGYDRPRQGGRGGRGAGYRGYDALIGRRYDESLGREPMPWRLGYPELPFDSLPGPYIPFGWDPMMRWSGWGPGVGYVPQQDAPRRRPPPRESPTYGRGGDDEVRRWARRHGYRDEGAVRPRRGRYDR
jgi:hypothetical protein